MKISKGTKKLAMWTLATVIVTMLLTLGLSGAASPSQTMTITQGVYPGAPSYTVYALSGTYYAKDQNGLNEFSGTDAATVINAAVDDNKIVFITSGSYVLTAPISIASVNNCTISGEGKGKTILQNYGIIKNSATATYNVVIKDLTIDIQDTADGNAINLELNSYNFRISNCELKNTNNLFLLDWGGVDNLLVENCLFYDGGLTGAIDNAAGSQLTSTPYVTTFKNNLFVKSSSVGGGMLTCGASGNLLIDGNTFIDYSNNSYAAISLENYYGTIFNVTIINNKASGYGGQAIFVGNDDNKNSGKAIIANNICEGIVLEGFKEGVISNNIIANSQYGIYLYNSSNVVVSNNIIHDTNFFGSAYYYDKGCVFASYITQLSVVGNTFYDALSITPYGVSIYYTTTVWINGNNFVGSFQHFNASDYTGNTNYIMQDNVVYGTYFENATT